MTLSKHAESLRREMAALQALLRCACEGVGPDRLLFRFWDVDRAERDREFHFALDLSGDAYKGASASRPSGPCGGRLTFAQFWRRSRCCRR